MLRQKVLGEILEGIRCIPISCVFVLKQMYSDNVVVIREFHHLFHLPFSIQQPQTTQVADMLRQKVLGEILEGIRRDKSPPNPSFV